MDKNDRLKEQLGDELCKYCPFANGEVDKKCDSQCDGRYCDIALENYKEEKEIEEDGII